MDNFEMLVKHEAGISHLEEDIELINEKMKFQFRRTSKLKASFKKNKIATALSILGLSALSVVTIRELYKAELKIDELEEKLDSRIKAEETKEE